MLLFKWIAHKNFKAKMILFSLDLTPLHHTLPLICAHVVQNTSNTSYEDLRNDFDSSLKFQKRMR